MSSPESTNQSLPNCPHAGVLAPAKEEEIEQVEGALASSDDHRVNALGLIHLGLSSASRREPWSPHSPGFSFVPTQGYWHAPKRELIGSIDGTVWLPFLPVEEWMPIRSSLCLRALLFESEEVFLLTISG